MICGRVGDKRAGSGASGDFGGSDRGEDSITEGFLTTIVSEASLYLEGVLWEEFLPESNFLKPEVGCDFIPGLLSRSAGSGDKRGGRSIGFSDDGLEVWLGLLEVSFFGREDDLLRLSPNFPAGVSAFRGSDIEEFEGVLECSILVRFSGCEASPDSSGLFCFCST
jgi:hypothetical protein